MFAVLIQFNSKFIRFYKTIPNMDRCRICMSSKRNLRSIFESTADGNVFVVMMESLANVKISKDDESSKNICQICCNKLVAACSFKVQLVRSEEVLQRSASSKKICFSNLQDIKIEILDPKLIIPKCENKIDNYFKDGEGSVFYNNTIIKKVEAVKEVNKKEPLSVTEYLNNFTAGSDHDYDDDLDFATLYTPQSDNEDPKHVLPFSERKQKPLRMKLRNYVSTDINDDYGPRSDNEDQEYLPRNNIKKRKKPRKKGQLRKVLIKPVILSDIQVLRSKDMNERGPKKKYFKKIKLAMCSYCGKMTKSLKSHLLIHSHTGEKQYKCDFCNKAFYTEKYLNNHKQTHTLEKIFKCDQCVAAFVSKTLLKSHVIKHSEEKIHVCEFCNKSFKRKYTLDRHKLAHNVTNKCVKCELCNMSFFSKFGLKHHMRVHTGERPYKCEICSQPYSYKHDFNRHCFNKHGIFLKRRSVSVMNEEVLARERALMQDLMLKLRGAGGELRNPFEGPQAAMAFEQAIKALQSRNIPIDR